MSKVVINEEIIKKLVAEALGMLLEAPSIKWGSSGQEFHGKPASELTKDIPQSLLDRIDSGARDIRDKDIPTLFGNTTYYKFYTQYKNAMEHKKKTDSNGNIVMDYKGNPVPYRSATSFWYVLNMLRSGKFGDELTYYENNGSYIVGSEKMGAFYCVYISPVTRMALLPLLQGIGVYTNVVFPVTDEYKGDMADMLRKLGCPQYHGKIVPSAEDDVIQCKHQGGWHPKNIFGTTQEVADLGAKIMFSLGITKRGFFASDDEIADFLLSDDKILEGLLSNPDIQKKVKWDAKTLVALIKVNPSLLKGAIKKIRG